jgi:exodeoxyribonuclease VII large subunit
MSLPTLGVAALTEAIKENLEAAFGHVAVEGEIGAMTRHRSGHWYFNLVEGKVNLNAVMFRGNNQRLNWAPEVGDKVVAVGGIDVYAPHGKYNLIVRKLMPSGEGARARALEQLKAKLAEEGLFDADRKRALPYLPQAVGIATSATGAALQDMLNVIFRRFPCLTIYLAPCRVQGEGAAEEVAEAIRLLNAHGKSEVIIVGRGGGAIEDLWAFNEEALVRAIVASAIPVVSAVGHETDTTLADHAADVRAPTPSAAAELVVPEQAALLQLVDELWDRQLVAMSRCVLLGRERLEELRLLHPGQRLKEQHRRLEEAQGRLVRTASLGTDAHRARLAGAAGRLDALSPLAVLGRGYAIVRKKGQIVMQVGQLSPGDEIEIRLRDGEAQAEVTVLTPVSSGN